MTVSDQVRPSSLLGLGAAAGSDRGVGEALSAFSSGDAGARSHARSVLDQVTGSPAEGEIAVRAASPVRLASAAALPGSMSGLGWGVDAIEVAEAIRLLRIGSLVGLAMFLTTPPPRPSFVQLAPDLLFVGNWAPGVHAFYVRGTDAKWRMAPVTGRGTPEGQLLIDLPALEQAYGRPLPPGVLAMAKTRPPGVTEPALQTTDASIAAAMSNADDPCKNLPGQRHHMIPATLMSIHQTFLKRIGFTLDQGKNLIKLPANGGQQQTMAQQCQQQRLLHNGRTAKIYENAVSDRLNFIEGQLNRSRITEPEALNKVNRLMDEIRKLLESGRYTNVNDPALARAIAAIQL